jgi:hypothetical protein
MTFASPRARGLILAGLHLVLVASFGGKLLLDRAVRPRVWVRTAPQDPELPIRGRYVSLRVEVRPTSELHARLARMSAGGPVTLAAERGELVAYPAGTSTNHAIERPGPGGERIAVLRDPVAFFIPEHVRDPSIRAPGEELWVEVTVPERGSPRPIQLGIKKDGEIAPLDQR